MAYDNKEVETKFQVPADQLDRLGRYLMEAGVVLKKSTQVDHYYSPKGNSYIAHKYPYEWLSVRERQPKNSLNYKHFYPEGAERHAYCDEYDVAVDDPQIARRLLEATGFEQLVTVRKDRTEFCLNDDVVVALDVVAGLGAFVEVEAMHDAGDGTEGAQRMVNRYAKQLGLDAAGVDPRGYPYQLLHRAGKL